MREPTILQFTLVIGISLVLALCGLYFLANFKTLFKSRIRNELLRRNIIAFLAITCLSSALGPMNGNLFYLIQKHGWTYTLVGQLVVSLGVTLVVYNTARFVAENARLKRLGFIKHMILVGITISILVLIVNTTVSTFVYKRDKDYTNFLIISSIYLGGIITLVYAITAYLDTERKRKFHEKELELSRLRELKTKAELEALHSKVNPHFLYNALNSIADLAVTDGRKARRMTIALADLFRYSINYSQNNYSTVNDEVTMTEVYLQIEKIRFEDQLNFSVNIAPDAGHYLLPRFLLQPIAENAVKHGLKATGRMTEIRLDVSVKNDGLLVTVEDNGPAFPDELVPGYGVKSVFDKMDLLFPGQYDIRFSNEPRKQVSIHLHKLMKNEPTV